jgi:acetoin utilization protein AcuC
LGGSALIWSPELAQYSFGPDHPLNPRRLELTLALMEACGLLGADTPVIPPRPATEEELLRVHARDYIDAVKANRPNLQYGLGTDDVPVIEAMHELAARVAGSTLVAAEAVMSGQTKRAFSIAGGLHHARRAEAAGFCVYSDLALAIAHCKSKGARVMYIDYDAHHGDGVQQIFYDDPEVLTVSFHESGTYLFPGTGFVDEIGTGDGTGYSVNVPLDAHTEDDSFRQCFVDLVPELADAFRPDVIVLQNGCDAHVLDPLTHLRCTTSLFEQLTRTVCEIADHYCESRMVATGGGGYAIYTVVPRAWTLVWAVLSGTSAPERVPDAWLRAARLECRSEVPVFMRDPADAFPPSPRRAAITKVNDQSMRAVRQRVLPLLTGWGLAF